MIITNGNDGFIGDSPLKYNTENTWINTNGNMNNVRLNTYKVYIDGVLNNSKMILIETLQCIINKADNDDVIIVFGLSCCLIVEVGIFPAVLQSTQCQKRSMGIRQSSCIFDLFHEFKVQRI